MAHRNNYIKQRKIQLKHKNR